MRIIAALDEGPRTLEALVDDVQSDRRAVARHARVLEQAGLVSRTRLGRTTTFRLTKIPFFSDGDYGALPQAPRTAAVAAALAHSHTAAVSALEGGGFDRSDIHLSRTSLDITERQWRELATAFAHFLERVEATADEPADPSDGHVRANAVLMLFERHAGGEPHDAPHGDEPGALEAGLEDAWQLSEQIDDALSGADPDWPAVMALAERLRVVARAAGATPAAPVERTPALR